MEKIWYIILNEKREGPYSLQDMRKDKRISPETLVWKEGFDKWIPIGEVPELKAVFQDVIDEPEDEEGAETQVPADEEIILQLKEDPPSFLRVLIILSICLLIYLLMKYYW